MALITKKELIVLVLFSIVGALWFIFIIPFLQASSWFLSLDPVSAFLIYNTGEFLLITAVFSVPMAILLKRKLETDIVSLLVGGFFAFSLFTNIFAMWSPPLAWNTSGQFLLPLNSALENPAVDHMYGWLFLQLGGPVWFVFYFCYLVVPFLTFLLFIVIYGQREVIAYASKMF